MLGSSGSSVGSARNSHELYTAQSLSIFWVVPSLSIVSHCASRSIGNSFGLPISLQLSQRHRRQSDRQTDRHRVRQSDTTTVSLKSMRTLGQHSKFCAAAAAAASCARTRTPNPNPNPQFREPCGLTNETQPNNLVSCTYACAVRLTYRERRCLSNCHRRQEEQQDENIICKYLLGLQRRLNAL